GNRFVEKARFQCKVTVPPLPQSTVYGLARSNCYKRHAITVSLGSLPKSANRPALEKRDLRAAISILVFLLLMSLAGFAAEPPSGPEPQTTVLSAAVPPLVQPIVVVPKTSKAVSTRKFWTLTALSAAMTVADIELTQNCLSNVRGCYETD